MLIFVPLLLALYFFTPAALMAAAKEGHQLVVHELLEAGADANIKSKSGITALMAAAKDGRAAIGIVANRPADGVAMPAIR